MKRSNLLLYAIAAVLIVLIVVTTARGKTPSEVEGQEVQQKPLASGFVSAIDYTTGILEIHGGQIRIDASAAGIRGPNHEPSSLSTITPGALVHAVFIDGTYPRRGPIPATIVQRSNFSSYFLTLTGAIQSKDLTARSFQILGQDVAVTDQTRFGGSMAALDPQSLEELPIGAKVTVFLSAQTDRLVADRVYVIAPTPDQHVAFRAILLKIEGNTWFVKSPQFSQFKVTSSTSIEGQPRPYQHIFVSGRIDAGVLTAEVIEEAPQPCSGFNPNPTVSQQAILTERGADFIVIDDLQTTTRARITSETLDNFEAQPGDNVDVFLERRGHEWLVKSILKIDYAQLIVVGQVTAIGASSWTIDGHDIAVNAETSINGNPQVGDQVTALVLRDSTGKLTARNIIKRP